MNQYSCFKKKVSDLLIIFVFCLGLSPLQADDMSEYLIVNFWLPGVEEMGFKLLLSDGVKTRLKTEVLFCHIKKDGVGMGLSLDSRPYLIRGDFDVGLGIYDVGMQKTISETRHVAEGHQNISNSLKHDNGRFFIGIQNARFTSLSKFLSEMKEFPIFSSEEEVRNLPDGEMGCYYWKP